MSDAKADKKIEGGSGGAAPSRALLEAHYDEFRRIAGKVLNGEARVLQIQPTDLAHEAAIRLVKLNDAELGGRTHFLALSARMMRQILIDEIRRLRARKRQIEPIHTQWPGADSAAAIDLEALDAALIKLEVVDPERARLIERRFFAGLTVEEIAELDGVSPSTVKRQWRAARAWLVVELQDG